jgi:hypothetical protein
MPPTPISPMGDPAAGGSARSAPTRSPRAVAAEPVGQAAARSARSTAEDPTRDASKPRSGRRAGRRKFRRSYLLAATAAVVAVAAGAAFELMPSAGPAHVIATPARMGSYVQAPALAASMKAAQLRNNIVSQSSGEVSHVAAAVYEDSTGPAAKSGPEIILLIGGNLSGSSASSFITSFMGSLPGAATAAAGSLGGSAACVPSVAGRPAECVWADNDTFGLLASPTLGVQALANELRQMRPQVEHLAK